MARRRQDARESPGPSLGVITFPTTSGRACRAGTAAILSLTIALAAAGGEPEPDVPQASPGPAADPIPAAEMSVDDRALADMHRAADRPAARAAQAATRASRSVKTSASPAVAEQTRQVAAPPAAPARKTTTKKTTNTRAAKRTTGTRTARAAVAVPDGGRAAVVISFALAQVGKPYVFGAAGPGSYDCSGLLKAAFARVGISLYHQSGAIATRGAAVARADWRPGDVLAWRNRSGVVGHVAIYLGNGQIVHASRRGVPVKVAPVYGAPFGRRLL